MKLKVVFLVGAMFVNTAAHAQDVCTGILRYASRDLTSYNSDVVIAQSIYSNYCRSLNQSSSNQTDIGIEAVVKQIPIRFNLGTGSASQKLESFCREMSQSDYLKEKVDQQQSIVVREALTSFVDCVRLSNKNVTFDPLISRTNVTVAIGRGGQKVDVQGVRVDEKLLACTAPDSDSSPKTTKADLDIRKSIADGTYSISCARIPIEERDGTLSYPEAHIAILTNQGPFSLTIPTDALMPRAWSTDLIRRQAELDEKIAYVAKNNASVVDALAKKQNRIAAGSYTAGPANDGNTRRDSGIPLTRAYKKPPIVIASVSEAHPVDMLVLRVDSIGTKSFNTWTTRVAGGPWSANFIINWIEIGEPEDAK
ncbi:hypothetical protein [Reyranella sp.]|uniref:hypothetical protein n=1 Tax=Reyranella sp. TaxID=1929291 RepID=UPI003BA90657